MPVGEVVMRRRCIAVGVALAVVLSLGVAAPGWAEDPPEARREMVELVTTNPLPLEDFLKVVGKIARIPFLWEPSTRELAQADFVAAMNIRTTRDDLFGLVRTILASYDLALVPIGPKGYEVYRVMAMRDLAGAAIAQPRFVELDRHNVAEYETQDGLLISTTMRAKYSTDLASVRSALLAHATRDGVGRVAILPDLPGFAVTDFAPAVVAMRNALQQIDVPQPEPRQPARVSIRIDLKHADAKRAAAGLAAHFGANLPLPKADGLTPTTRKAPVLGLRILADERTNALLVSGSPDRVGEVEEAVTLLDVPAERASTWIHVHELKHVSAASTALALRQLIANSQSLGGEADARTKVVPYRHGNKLLVEATPRVWEQLLAILQTLDVGPEGEAR